jgi:hypothetical protein
MADSDPTATPTVSGLKILVASHQNAAPRTAPITMLPASELAVITSTRGDASRSARSAPCAALVPLTA